MAGTPASLKMLTQLLVSNEVTGVEAEMWLTTLAFIQEPTLLLQLTCQVLAPG